MCLSNIFNVFLSVILCVCRLYYKFAGYTMCLSVMLRVMCLSIIIDVFRLCYYFDSVFHGKKYVFGLRLKSFNYACNVYLIYSRNKIFNFFSNLMTFKFVDMF